MEQIINKLDNIYDNELNISVYKRFNDWTLQEKKQLLEIYYIICKNEHHIFDLVYSLHGCDSWEDVFRDYNCRDIDDKTDGVKIALDELEKIIDKNKTYRCYITRNGYGNGDAERKTRIDKN